MTTHSLTLTVPVALALFHTVAAPSADPMNDPSSEADKALRTLVYGEVGDFLVAQGGDVALPVLVRRAQDVCFRLSADQENQRRHTAADKLYTLGDALLGVSDLLLYPSEDEHYVSETYDAVRDAYSDLGRQTRALLPAAVVAMIESLPSGTTAAASAAQGKADCCGHCEC